MKGQREPVENVNKEHFCEKERPFRAIKRLCKKMWRNLNELMVDAKVWETMDSVAQYLMSNPLLLAACISVIASIAIPLLLFVLFAIVNVAFAFTSFIIIEVTVLTIGATVLCFMLFCVISTITVMGLCLLLIYYVSYYILSLVNGVKVANVKSTG